LEMKVFPLGDTRNTTSPSLPLMPLIQGSKVTFAMLPAFSRDTPGAWVDVLTLFLRSCYALLLVILCASCIDPTFILMVLVVSIVHENVGIFSPRQFTDLQTTAQLS